MDSSMVDLKENRELDVNCQIDGLLDDPSTTDQPLAINPGIDFQRVTVTGEDDTYHPTTVS